MNLCRDSVYITRCVPYGIEHWFLPILIIGLFIYSTEFSGSCWKVVNWSVEAAEIFSHWFEYFQPRTCKISLFFGHPIKLFVSSSEKKLEYVYFLILTIRESIFLWDIHDDCNELSFTFTYVFQFPLETRFVLCCAPGIFCRYMFISPIKGAVTGIVQSGPKVRSGRK